MEPGAHEHRPSLARDYQRDWPRYFDFAAGRPARDTLGRALREVTRRGRALDIACGEGRDTRAILSDSPGWRVVALDSSREGLTRLRASLSPEDAGRVVLVEAGMEELPALHASGRLDGTGGFDLINASFALPFCDPARFGELWAWILATLERGGCFAGQFFGDRDEWASIRPESHHTLASVTRLLGELETTHFEEVEKAGSDAMGGTKHHHVFHVVARRAR